MKNNKVKIYYFGKLSETVNVKPSRLQRIKAEKKTSKFKVGSNQFRKNPKSYIGTYFAAFILFFLLLCGVRYLWLTASARVSKAFANEIVSPLPDSQTIIYKDRAVYFLAENIDSYVGEAVDEFYKTPAERSHMRELMHCLLYKESKHDSSKGHGDGGLASGPLQYHQPTWDGFRKIMIDRGLAKEVGSLYDQKEAIRTTVWAFKDGRGNNWGPFLRGECK